MSGEFRTYDEQIAKLLEKGLAVSDVAAAKSKLAAVGYFALVGGYKEPLRDPSTRRYKPGVSFDDVVALYDFDDALRDLFFQFLQRWQRGDSIEQPALANDEPTLPELEQYYRKLDLYFSFAKAFDCEIDEDELYDTRERVADQINEILLHRLRSNIRFCAACGKPLPLHHHGRLCDACWMKERSRHSKKPGWQKK